MSLLPQSPGPIPAETARVARAAFPKGHSYLPMRAVRGPSDADPRVAPLCATRGRPAAVPWRRALSTVMQVAAGRSDRQTANAVRGRIEWKSARGVEVTDPGVDVSVLSAFRARLVAGSAAQAVLDALLIACRTGGYRTPRGRQRTDSTHVRGARRGRNRLEHVAEALRAALKAVATTTPDGLRAQTAPEWGARYGRRVEDSHRPNGKQARQAYGEQVGCDGMGCNGGPTGSARRHRRGGAS